MSPKEKAISELVLLIRRFGRNSPLNLDFSFDARPGGLEMLRGSNSRPTNDFVGNTVLAALIEAEDGLGCYITEAVPPQSPRGDSLADHTAIWFDDREVRVKTER